MMTATRFAAPALLGALLLAVPAPARAEQKETERVDRTAPIGAGALLKLKNFSGHVTITGTSRSDMAIHAVRRATRDRLDHIKLDIQETNAGVTIDANQRDSGWTERDNNVVETDFDIEVPADINVDVDAFSSDVTVKDVRGKQRVKTFSGEVNLSGGESSVSAETFSGNIGLTVPQGVSASIDFNSFSGSMRADVPMTYRSSSRSHVRADIGGGGSGYDLKTFSGDVKIR
jgi:DUF4097 and DUF4098 domain-containing protein YvlB